jgi:hypothetical protein
MTAWDQGGKVRPLPQCGQPEMGVLQRYRVKMSGNLERNIFIGLAGIYLLWLAVFGFAKRSCFFRCSVRPHLPHDVAACPAVRRRSAHG